MADQFVDLDATAQAELIRNGEAQALELVEAAIARVETFNPQLNAIIHPLFEKACAQARSTELPDGPFRGVPFVMKDLLGGPAGEPLHNGMQLLKTLGYTSPQDTYLSEKFRQAGFISVGRTNTPEWGLMGTTEPAAYGPTHNPWNLAHSPGGSSGGSAAAVAARLVAVGHGGDGGGSLRIPASMCGIVGLKPSRGRLSLGPAMGECWHGLATEGVMTRSVRDMAGVLDAVAGSMPGDPYAAPSPARPYQEEVTRQPGRLRVGLMLQTPANRTPLHNECKTAVEQTGRLLESLGHSVEVAHPAAYDEPEWLAHFGRVVQAHSSFTAHDLGTALGRPLEPDDVEPYTWGLIEEGRKISAEHYLASANWLQIWTRRMASWWTAGFDLLVTSTLGEPPPVLGDMGGPSEDVLAKWQRNIEVIPFTPACNATGQPALSLPLAWSADGLPVGVHFVPAYGQEDLLLRLAAQLEAAQPWATKRPPVCA